MIACTLMCTSSLTATRGLCAQQHPVHASSLNQRWQHSSARQATSPLNGASSHQSSLLCFSSHKQSPQQSELPEELQRARNIKQVGLTASGTILITAAAAALTAGMRPPDQLMNSIQLEHLLWTCGTVSGTMLCALSAAKLTLGVS